jgi:hypothetical protein
MSFLRNLFGFGRAAPGVEQLPDRVWVSTPAKLAGIRRELDTRVQGGAAWVGLVAHFPDVLGELVRLAEDCAGPASVRALLARELSSDSAARLKLDASSVLDLIVAERHPLASVDAELLAFAGTLPCRCRVAYHVSLDDAVMRAFGTETLLPLLERLGATDDEPIEHPMIARIIGRAQQRIEATAHGRADARSAAEWLERNAGG